MEYVDERGKDYVDEKGKLLVPVKWKKNCRQNRIKKIRRRKRKIN